MRWATQLYGRNGREWSTAIPDRLRAQGVPIDLVREEFRWDAIETKRGEYDWSASDRYMADYRARGIQVHAQFLYSNEFYDPGMKTAQTGVGQNNAKQLGWPAGDDAAAAMADFIIATLERYPEIVEIALMNEANGSDRGYYDKYSRAAAKALVALMRVIYRKVKAAHPSVVIIGGALIFLPVGYLGLLVEEGLLDVIDALEAHPYYPMEDVPYRVAEARQVLAAAGKPAMSIKALEWGNPSNSGDETALSQYLFRGLATLPTAGFDLASWFLGADSPRLDVYTGLCRNSAKAGYPLTDQGRVYAYYLPWIRASTPKPNAAVLPSTRIYPFVHGSGLKWWMCYATPFPTKVRVQGNHVARDRFGTNLPKAGTYTVGPEGLAIFGAVKVTEYFGSKVPAFHTGDFSLVEGERGWSYRALMPDLTELPMHVVTGDEERYWTDDTGRCSIKRGRIAPGHTNGKVPLWSAMLLDLPPAPYPNRKHLEVSWFARRASEKGDGTEMQVRLGDQAIYREVIADKADRLGRAIVTPAGPARFQVLCGTGPQTPPDRNWDDLRFAAMGMWTPTKPSKATAPVLAT